MDKLTSKPIKISYDGEVRKIKDIHTFKDFLAAIEQKMKINPEKHEMYYIDQDGDNISLSTSTDFEEYLASNDKLPKIELKRIDSDFDNNPIFKNIQMTQSTMSRPNQRQESVDESGIVPDESNFDQDLDILDSSINNTESNPFDTIISNSIAEENKAESIAEEIQTEELKNVKSDEKGTETVNDTSSNSVQTQPVLNADAGTDVRNLVINTDQESNTEEKKTFDKSSQQIVDVFDHGLDPIKSSVSDQAVDVQMSQPKLDDIDEKLSLLVKEHLHTLIPEIVNACNDYIRQSLNVSEQKNLLGVSVHQVAWNHCHTCPIIGVRYKCIQCSNVDYCSKCEEIANHEHPVLKIRSEESLENYYDSLKQSGIYKSSIASSIFQSMMSRPNIALDNISMSDSKILDELEQELAEKDPVIEDEKEDIKNEYPEMVKRSQIGEYRNFSDAELSKICCKRLDTDEFMWNTNSEKISIEIKVVNNDTRSDSRWPLNTTLKCISHKPSPVILWNSTLKEIKQGSIATFKLDLKTPNAQGKYKYGLILVDEFDREYGNPIEIVLNALNVDIVDPNQNYSAFEEPEPQPEKVIHDALLKYPHAVKYLKELGIDTFDQKILDMVLKMKGNIELICEKLF